MGCLITLYTMGNLVEESNKYGVYKNKLLGKLFPKINVISVQEILKGKRIEFPTKNIFKKAKIDNSKNKMNMDL